MTRECPNLARCPVRGMFEASGTIQVWTANYCTSRYETCARFQTAQAGRTVPKELLPNGRLLPRLV